MEGIQDIWAEIDDVQATKEDEDVHQRQLQLVGPRGGGKCL